MASGLSGCSDSGNATAYNAAADAIWRTADSPSGGMAGIFRDLIRYATLAANSHNTQPWKYTIQAPRISISPDYGRRCPAVDPDDHHLFASLGCAIENLSLAAQARGFNGEVGYETDRDDIVSVSLTPVPAVVSPLFDAIPRRQSTRADYDGKTPSSAEVKLLELRGCGDGVNVVLLTDRRRIENIIDYVRQANTVQMGDSAFLAELRRWIRFNEDEALRTRDGLFSGCSGHVSLPRWLGSAALDLFVKPQSENDRYARQVRSSAGVVVLVTDANDHRHWIEVGRRAQRFALQATALGMRVAFINQPVEVPMIRSQLATYLAIGDRRPDLVMRFGYGPEMPRSLRRPIEQVIVR
jgi:hypothetical protein